MAANRGLSFLVSLFVLLAIASATRNLKETENPQNVVGVGIGIGSGRSREGGGFESCGGGCGGDCSSRCGGGGVVIGIPGISVPGVNIPGVSIEMPGGGGGYPRPIYIPGPGGCTTMPPPGCSPSPMMPGCEQSQPEGAKVSVDSRGQEKRQPDINTNGGDDIDPKVVSHDQEKKPFSINGGGDDTDAKVDSHNQQTKPNINGGGGGYDNAAKEKMAAPVTPARF